MFSVIERTRKDFFFVIERNRKDKIFFCYREKPERKKKPLLWKEAGKIFPVSREAGKKQDVFTDIERSRKENIFVAAIERSRE